jgi:hypothetical protein
VSLQREVLAFPRKREPTATGGWFRIKDMDLLRRRVVVRTKHSMKGHGTRDLQRDVFEERKEWAEGLTAVPCLCRCLGVCVYVGMWVCVYVAMSALPA